MLLHSLLYWDHPVGPVFPRFPADHTDGALVIFTEEFEELLVHLAQVPALEAWVLPRHLSHLGQQAIGPQVPLGGQLTALRAREGAPALPPALLAFGLLPGQLDALAAEVMATGGHHGVGEIVEADGTCRLFLQLSGKFHSIHSPWERNGAPCRTLCPELQALELSVLLEGAEHRVLLGYLICLQ